MKYLRIRNAVPVLLFTVLLGGCFKNESLQQDPVTCKVVPNGDTVVIALEETVPIFQQCLPSLTASISAIRDSRCPIGANCITAGTVEADLQLGDQFTVTLEKGKVLDTLYQGNRFLISLLDVTPYPDVHSGSGTTVQKAYIHMKKE
ncbi:MAG: hypothetical protein KGO92_07125 [Bacteroidota bacterium]|nr:hypothetical protein [Bacteroidota bacterium]